MKRVRTLSAIGVLVALLGSAALPWQVRDPAYRAAVVRAMAGQLGVDVSIGGFVTFKLLPRPRIQLSGVSASAPDGSLTLDSATVSADLDIPSALHGRLRLVSATLGSATVALRLEPGQLSSQGLSAPQDVGSQPFRLSFRSSVIRISSRAPLFDTLLTDVNATALRQGNADGGLSLSGEGLWHGVHGKFALSVPQAEALRHDGTSPITFSFASRVGSLSATGDISGGPQAQFAGHLMASTGALPDAASAFELGPLWVGARRAGLSGTAVIKSGDLALSDATLRLDDALFEGALAVHSERGRALIEGTLATAALDLDKLAGRKLDRRAFAALFDSPAAASLAAIDLDLRISASEARLGPIEAKDAAMSALLRDGRLEVTLDEAQVYGGSVRAHALANGRPAHFDAHTDLALSGVDLAQLAAVVGDHETVTGTVSGKLAIDGQGANPAEFLQSMQGDGQVTVEHGRFAGVSISQALKRLTRKLPPVGDQTGQTTAFTSASASIGITAGTVHLTDGTLVGPGIRLDFAGQTDLPLGRLDIKAVAAQTDPTGAALHEAPRLPISMQGTWDAPSLVVRHDSAVGVPGIPFPSFDDQPGIP